MTVTVAWQGAGRQFTANISTDTGTILKYRGTGGTPIAAAADGAIEGTDALTVAVNKTGVCFFVLLPTALDFSVGGTEEGQLIYVWGNFLAAGILATQADADGGFGICLSSGTPSSSNYSLFSFYGSDNYSGGWKRMVLDPTKTRSAGVGTLTTSNITHIGVFANVGTTTARFDNLILDACDVGTGLKVTGTSTLGLMKELLANEAANAYGIVTALNDSETAFELSGELIIGDDAGTAATTVVDEDSKIFASEPKYYNGGSVASCPVTFTGFKLVGNGTGATSVIIGKQVGSDKGRNGWSVVGNATYDVGFDFDDGNVNTCEFYGTVFEELTGVLSWGSTTAHKAFSVTFNNCEQFDPVGGIQQKNMTFSNYVGTDGALLWNASIDITGQFINTDRGVEVTQTTTQTFNDLTFDDEVGNFDVHLNNGGTSITINKTGIANPNSYTATGGGVVTFSATYTLTLSGLVSTTRVVIVNSTTRTVLSDQTATITGILTYDHSGAEEVDIMCYHNDYDVYNIIELTLDSGDQGVLISQTNDLFYSNP